MIVEAIVNSVEAVPAPLRVVLLSMIPITEYQLSIPLGIQAYQLSPMIVFSLAIIGSLGIFFPVYFGLDWLRHVLERVLPKLILPIDAFLNRAKQKLDKKYATYGMWALFIFLAIPFPLTGIWTAAAAAVALRIPFRQAAIGILTGMLCGASVVLAVTLLAGEAASRI
jgi:uncharacterized membrane protein